MTEANTVVELGAEYVQDPYSAHQRLRAQGPVSRVILPGGYLWALRWRNSSGTPAR
jgi:hypothetical protein